ncbi:MAG: enoyl-CoA hydratase/isomerase family protein [Sphingomonas bacterium]
MGAVNGVCWAPEMLNAFDFVLCAEHATFAQGDMMIGICPGGGSTQTLPRVVGRRHALDFLLRPRAISAEQAYRIGLVNEIVPAAELMDRATALAAELSAYPEGAVEMTKLAVTRAPEVRLVEGMAMEQDCFVLSTQSGFIGGFAKNYWDRKKAKA